VFQLHVLFVSFFIMFFFFKSDFATAVGLRYMTVNTHQASRVVRVGETLCCYKCRFTRCSVVSIDATPS